MNYLIIMILHGKAAAAAIELNTIAIVMVPPLPPSRPLLHTLPVYMSKLIEIQASVIYL